MQIDIDVNTDIDIFHGDSQNSGADSIYLKLRDSTKILLKFSYSLIEYFIMFFLMYNSIRRIDEKVHLNRRTVSLIQHAKRLCLISNSIPRDLRIYILLQNVTVLFKINFLWPH